MHGCHNPVSLCLPPACSIFVSSMEFMKEQSVTQMEKQRLIQVQGRVCEIRHAVSCPDTCMGFSLERFGPVFMSLLRKTKVIMRHDDLRDSQFI